MNSKVYKWCAVPQCKNTTIKTPNKIFVHVPYDKTVRRKWLKLARRNPTAIVSTSALYFCEDHFDLPNDMENYMKYHVMGSVSQVRMKPGCMPRKFTCQPDRKTRTSDTTERPYIAKKRRIMILEECIKEYEKKYVVREQSSFEEIASSSSEGALYTIVKQECPEELQASSAAAGAGVVKEEPADEAVEMQWEFETEVGPLEEGSNECSEEEAPKPLIDIVKCEPTLIQTLDDGLRSSHCSAPASTAPSAEAPAAAVSATGHRNKPSKLINSPKRMKLEYSCDVCNKTFSNKRVLNEHKRIHSKRKPKIHKCDMCGDLYNFKCHLDKHMNVHTKLAKWECDVCNKVFYDKSTLYRHMNGQHTKLVKWECHICNKVFYDNSNFQRHMNGQHSNLIN